MKGALLRRRIGLVAAGALLLASVASLVTPQKIARAQTPQIINVANPVAPPGGQPSPTASWEPTPPFSATFFYGWYANPNTNPTADTTWQHWGDQSGAAIYHHPTANWFAHYLPDANGVVGNKTSDLYSSSDYATFSWQMKQLAAARQTVGIYSWWGPAGSPRTDSLVGTPSDKSSIDMTFRSIITNYMNRADSPYPNFRWAIYYEPEGYGDPSVSAIESDLNYILANYAKQRSYLWINGKPVIFVYNAKDPNAGSDYWQNDLNRWVQVRSDMAAAGKPFYISMKDDPLWHGASTSAMDSWHAYDPVQASGTVSGFSAFVSPGFWREQDLPRLERSPSRFTTNVQSMASTRVNWKITETWNEWQEGTSVEPGAQWNWAYDRTASTKNPAAATPVPGGDFGRTYVNILGCHLPALENGLGNNGSNSYAVPAPTCG